MRDKGLQEMLATLTPRAEKVVLTAFSNPRAASVELLSKAMPTKLSLNKTSFANSAVEALQEALAITPTGGLVCVTGSLYLVGEIKKGLSVKHGL
jgi:dihydrofolate synthase/folylpolyglutamate synthase